MRWGGWRLVGGTAVLLGLMTAGIALVSGTDEVGARVLIRATARTSLVYFLAAFVASGLRGLWPSPGTLWLLRNRRYLGVSFALSHFLHLAAILEVAWRWPHPFLEQSARPVTLIGGGLGYVFIAAMTATSFDRSAAWLGARRWRLLHTAGMYYLWIIFTFSFGGRAVVAPAYALPALALLAGLTVRLASRFRALQLLPSES